MIREESWLSVVMTRSTVFRWIFFNDRAVPEEECYFRKDVGIRSICNHLQEKETIFLIQADIERVCLKIWVEDGLPI